jgi:alpha-glucosidase
MPRVFQSALLFLLPFTLLHAQSAQVEGPVVRDQKTDERRVVSPNGQLEFRIFVGQPEGALWSRLGFRIDYGGKPVLTTSWVGLDFRDQEPYLGENPGFMSSEAGSNTGQHYNYLLAHYMQNGTLGRQIDVEARAYDDGIAFRYVIPRTNPLVDFYLRDETTQFNFPPGVLNHLPQQPDFDLPFVVDEPGIGWLAIATPKSSKFPPTYLIRSGDGMLTNLPRSKADPTVAYTGVTPVTWMWRVLVVGPDREHLMQSEALRDLDH